jgi:hypothetical protein
VPGLLTLLRKNDVADPEQLLISLIDEEVRALNSKSSQELEFSKVSKKR